MGRQSKVWLAALWTSLALQCTCAHAVTVRLNEADALASVHIHVGDRLRIDLRSAPATGFRWDARRLDASHLQPLSNALRPDSDRLDTAGTQVFVWKAIAPGHAEIGLSYERPSDDKTVPAAKQLAVAVDIAPGQLTPEENRLQLDLPPATIYTGTLPCAGCLAIKAELTLQRTDTANAAQNAAPPAMVFLERLRTQGAPGGDRTIVDTGRVAVVHGTYADPSATSYVLDGPDGGSYRLTGNQLTLLDAQMLPVKSPQGGAMLLERQPPPTSPASEP